MKVGDRVRLTGSFYWPNHETSVVAIDADPHGLPPSWVAVTIPDGRIGRYRPSDVTVLPSSEETK